MATLATQVISRAGITPSLAAAAVGGDKFQPGENVYVEFKNTSGADITVTFATPYDVISNVATTDLAVVIPQTSGNKKIGPFPKSVFGNSADSGLCAMTYAPNATNLTVGAFSV